MSYRPAVQQPSSSEPEQRESGERRIALGSLKSTRVSQKVRLPPEALPSEPPPSPSPELLPVTVATPEDAKATARMGVPESVKLLRAAVPTPQAFVPAPPPPQPIASPQVEHEEEEHVDAELVEAEVEHVAAVDEHVIPVSIAPPASWVAPPTGAAPLPPRSIPRVVLTVIVASLAIADVVLVILPYVKR